MHRPQPLQCVRSSTMGTSPVSGLISVPMAMQSLVHELMHRPQPLQYSGTTKGLGRSASVVMARPPAEADIVYAKAARTPPAPTWDNTVTGSIFNPAERAGLGPKDPFGCFVVRKGPASRCEGPSTLQGRRPASQSGVVTHLYEDKEGERLLNDGCSLHGRRPRDRHFSPCYIPKRSPLSGPAPTRTPSRDFSSPISSRAGSPATCSR